jgi:hypothetical protein
MENNLHHNYKDEGPEALSEQQLQRQKEKEQSVSSSVQNLVNKNLKTPDERKDDSNI